MKKVIFKTETDTISVDELNGSHIIGVLVDDLFKGYILKVSCEKYVLSYLEGTANKFNSSLYHSIKEAIGKQKAYVFNTPKELYLWMAE